ncbi:MAG: hypothetical protein ABI370_09835, partial [Gammaproteobacteria bacterium]
MNNAKSHIILLVMYLISYAICSYGSSLPLQEHHFKNPKSIYSLSPKEISNILSHKSWNTSGQSITSAETNNDSNPVPEYEKIKQGDNSAGVNAFADIHFDKNVKRILDVGGGKFDVSRDFLQTKNIDLLIWDPYNRSKEHNKEVRQAVQHLKVDAATSMAVLNVIPEPDVRLAHIAILKQAIKTNSYAYFKVWPGEGKLKGTHQPTVNSYGYPGYQANAYVDYFLPEVQLVFGKDN